MEILYWTLLIIGGFLLGNIMFCQILPKKILKKDIYKISIDNNPGAFNVFKHCGIKIGIPCLVLDILKGFLPVLLASLFLSTDCIAFTFVLVAPALGHALGLFNRFHGGKCISTSFGITLGLIPVTWIGIVTLAALYLLFSTVIKISNKSKRSVLVFTMFALIVCPALGLSGLAYTATGCGLIALLPIGKFLFTKNGLIKNEFIEETVSNEKI